MSRSLKVWRWQLRIPADPGSLHRWEALIAEGFVPDGTLFRQSGRKTAKVEVFCEEADRAEDLRLAFGGRVEQVDANALMQPAAVGSAPLKIRDRLVVSESADPAEIAKLEKRFPDRAVLSFPPELAFGTGRHPTTGTCLRLLADIARERDRNSGSKEWTFLDLGHGTGILAIAAVTLGAAHATGIDCDEFAVEVANRNAGRHRAQGGRLWSERCDFSGADVCTWKPPRGRRYDVIAANLFSELLASQLARFSTWLADGGDVVVSGILHTQVDAVRSAADEAGLAFDAPKQRGKWVAMRGAHR